MTKPAPAPRRTFRHSDFGFLSSLVIRYLSFGLTGSWSQCTVAWPRGLSMNRPIVARASRPCEHADRHTGETPVPLLLYAGSSSQCMREGETGLSTNLPFGVPA